MNSISYATYTGPKLAVQRLQTMVSRGGTPTVNDSIAAAYLWSRSVGKSYPNFMDAPMQNIIAKEHVLGLIRSLSI